MGLCSFLRKIPELVEEFIQVLNQVSEVAWGASCFLMQFQGISGSIIELTTSNTHTSNKLR